MENKKYELCHTATYNGVTIHRIKSLKDFICDGILVRKGDIGGYVQSEDNLSQNGNCWIFDNGVAMDDSRIKDNASIHNDAMIFDKSIVCENASLYNFSTMFYKSMIAGNAILSGNARMHSQSVAIHNASIGGNAIIHGSAIIFDNAKVYGRARIYNNASISGNAKIFADMNIGIDAKIESPSDVIILDLINTDCTFYRNTSNSISVYYKHFNYPIEILEEEPFMENHKDIIKIVKQNMVF